MKIRVLISVVLVFILIGAASLVASEQKSAGTTEIAPMPNPVLAPDYQECPYCHYILPGKKNKDGKFSFDSHRVVMMPISETMVFETCERNYFLYLGPVMLDLKRTGMGRTVETTDDDKPPTDAPHTKTNI